MVSVRCFGVRVSVMFHFVFVHYTFNSVWVAEWPPFGGWLPARLAICSHCILSVCDIYLFPALVLGAGFAFWLLRFLFVAFLLLLLKVNIVCKSDSFIYTGSPISIVKSSAFSPMSGILH